MRRKGSLSLSVNAIVVFVLAFAMLSVGIIFTNYIKNALMEKGMGAINIEDLQTPPSATDPLTFPTSEMTIKTNGKKSIDIGYYNTGDSEAINAKPEFLKCISEDGTPTEDKPSIAAIPETVEPGTATGFRANINMVSWPKGTYICKIGVLNAGENGDGEANPDASDTESIGYIYETSSITINVQN